MSVYVEVNGQRFVNFTSLRLQRSKDDLTCSGSITLSWPGAEDVNAQGGASVGSGAPELKEGLQGTIYLDGQKAASIIFDKRSGRGTATSYQLDMTFRGKASVLVDSSADHPSGQENEQASGEIVKRLMDGYLPKLVDKSADSQTKRRFVIRDGETIERSIRAITREFGLIAYENEDGDIVLDKRDGDEGNGQPLRLGEHFLDFNVDRDISPRYSKIKVKGSGVSTDENYGAQVEALQEAAIDQYVQIKKELNLQVDGDQNNETLKQRAIFEANRRAAAGLNVTVEVKDWSDESGQLWKVGRMHHIVIPIEQVDDTLQLNTVQFNLNGTSRSATLNFVPKEAYSSEQQQKDGGKSAAGKPSDFSPITSISPIDG